MKNYAATQLRVSEDGEWVEGTAPDLTPLAKDKDVTVRYPVSFRYNGGMLCEGKWYKGYKIPEPLVPDTHEIVGIGMGFQMNATTPYATAVLRPKKA